jgi:undecaprenyl-diphosphatase
MVWLEIVVLAIIQGIGEFLPISSKGHVVIVDSLFHQFGFDLPEDKLTVNILLHFGTLLTILVFYWQRVWRLLGEDRRVIGLLLVGTLPVAVLGGLFKKQLEVVFENPLYVGILLPVTGLILLWSARRASGETTCRNLSYSKALLIGIAQCFALLPGISRSGTTIVAGLGVGLRRDEAATFSFLLAIPAIAGAVSLKAPKLLGELVHGSPDAMPAPVIALGVAVSFIVGLGALWWLNRWLQQGRLYRFAWWVIPVGVAVTIWQLWPAS